MQNKKVRTAIIILVTLWLLTGFSNISIAENIPISEEELEKIGLNKIRLESGIGVMVFNLSKGELTSNGYLSVSNTYNSSVTIRCQVFTKLSKVDLDENGSYRIHKKISNNITFKPIPDGSWITLEDDKAIVNPYSIYNFRYTVNIDVEYLREQAKKNNNVLNTSEGYLVYINTRKIIEDTSGMQIGIDYNYKLFIIFMGELEQENSISTFLLLLIIPVVVTIEASIFFYKKKKSKKVNVTHPHTNENKERKTSKDKSIPDSILRGKNV